MLLALALAFWDTRFAVLSTVVQMESHVRRSDDSDIFQHTPNSSHEHLKRQKDARSTRAFRGIK